MIFTVEDDESIREIEIYTLNSMGFKAQGFSDASLLFEALEKTIPDLIILDIMLPGESGVSILRRLKSSHEYRDIPVIMATAKGSEYDKVESLDAGADDYLVNDKVESLDAGADDYLVKPFGMMEMVSRVKAVLRRSGKKETSVLTLGHITLNKAEHVVMVEGRKIALTLKEFDLLELLMSNPGIVFTRETLLDRIWMQSAGTETRTVDAHIKTLRQKLGSAGALIETVRGVGYRIEG